jgi:hypothetical protein
MLTSKIARRPQHDRYLLQKSSGRRRTTHIRGKRNPLHDKNPVSRSKTLWWHQKPLGRRCTIRNGRKKCSAAASRPMSGANMTYCTASVRVVAESPQRVEARSGRAGKSCGAGGIIPGIHERVAQL